MNQPTNWRLTTDGDIHRLTLDVPAAKQNVLSAAVVAELDDALAEVERAAPAALVIASGKPRGFIAGADVSEFTAIESEAQAKELLARAHRVFNKLEALPMPTLALLNGHCLGGGLELALACDHRVAVDTPTVRIGLPEVLLGIHPGFGGSVRLIETVGVVKAMELMLSGRTVAPSAARRLGVVDFAVPARQLEATARFVLAQKKIKRRFNLSGVVRKILTTPPARAMLARVFIKKTAARVNQAHYPAPFKLIELWKQHGGDRDAMLKAEQASVAKLITTTTARNLVHIFFLREGLKKVRGGHDEKFNHAHIVGAGVMGGDIAAWCAACGLRVTLHDQNPAALADATRRAHALFKRKLKSPRLVQAAMDRFQPDTGGDGVRRADVVVEAIVENLDAKRALFAELQKNARTDALLATNTSSIPLESLNDAAGGKLVGLHFFNPVAKMQLVEVVDGGDAGVVQRAAAFAGRINRLPIVVKSAPGFLVNRILMPYLLEAMTLLTEGVKGATVDRAATEFGMPMGPVTLADTVGLDICLSVAQNLNAGGEALDALQKKVDAGHLGKKTGKGFYKWRDGKPQTAGGDANARTAASIRDRLVFRYLNEALACLHQGIVADAAHLNAGLIFATGFAPHLGGPVGYIVAQGQDAMLRKLGALEEQYGERFAANAGWKEVDLAAG